MSHIWFQKLDFTESEGPCSSEALPKRELSAEELSQRLEKLIMEDKADDERIFDWVEVHTLTLLFSLQSGQGVLRVPLPVLVFIPFIRQWLLQCI